MEREGYRGCYLGKAGSVHEGSATLWRADRWRLAEEGVTEMRMRDLVAEGDPPRWMPRGGYPFLDALRTRHPALTGVLSKVTTAALIVTLEPIDPAADRALVVANSHLFFHPRASHVRTLHAAVILDQLGRAARRHGREGGQDRPAVVWCGDFNADLNDGLPGLADLLQWGSVSARHWDWREVGSFAMDASTKPGAVATGSASEPGDADEADAAPAPRGTFASAPDDPDLDWTGQRDRFRPLFPENGLWVPTPLNDARGADLVGGIRLWACGGLGPDQLTNVVPGFDGQLDYVYIDRGLLDEVRAVPLPSEAEIRGPAGDGALPSKRFPSDHLAVVHDVAWRSKPGEQPPPLTCETEHLPAGLCALSAGEAVFLPTDTVAGLAVDATDASATEWLCRAKGGRGGLESRQAPMSMMVADPEDVARHCLLPPGLDAAVLGRLLPGSVTLVLPKRPGAPLLAPGVGDDASVGVRVPDHAFARALVRALGRPICLTSANKAGEPAPRSIDAADPAVVAFATVAYREAEVGAAAAAAVASTVVDLVPSVNSSTKTYRILRQGAGDAVVAEALGAAGFECVDG